MKRGVARGAVLWPEACSAVRAEKGSSNWDRRGAQLTGPPRPVLSAVRPTSCPQAHLVLAEGLQPELGVGGQTAHGGDHGHQRHVPGGKHRAGGRGTGNVRGAGQGSAGRSREMRPMARGGHQDSGRCLRWHWMNTRACMAGLGGDGEFESVPRRHPIRPGGLPPPKACAMHRAACPSLLHDAAAACPEGRIGTTWPRYPPRHPDHHRHRRHPCQLPWPWPQHGFVSE